MQIFPLISGSLDGILDHCSMPGTPAFSTELSMCPFYSVKMVMLRKSVLKRIIPSTSVKWVRTVTSIQKLLPQGCRSLEQCTTQDGQSLPCHFQESPEALL